MFSSVFHIFQIAPIRWPYDSCFLIVGSPSDGSAKDGMSGFGKVSSKGVKSGLRSQPKLRGGDGKYIGGKIYINPYMRS